MTVSGQALRMRLQLSELRERHRYVPTPVTVELSPPTDHDEILEGFASTANRDLDRVKFSSWAFGFPLLNCYKLVPLLYKHDHAQVAGQIEDLDYDGRDLVVRARVTHRDARRCNAFSIGAKVNSYTMHDTDSPNFYATVTSAELTEISITDCPSNPECKVMFRTRACAAVEHLDHAIAFMKTLQKAVALIQETRQ